MLVRQKLETSTSFRAIMKNFAITKLYLVVLSEVPSYTNIINWVHKIGYYHLTEKKKIADDWIIILDHSIKLGKDKMIVILGIRESNIDFTRPLQYKDLIPLRIESRTKWDGESVFEYLKKLEKELGKIKYAVGDYGSDIKKGLELAEIKHIHDITHRIALILKKIYKDDNVFQEFTKRMSQMRNQFSQTEIAHIIPPNQRTKSRYQNIKPISDWGQNAFQLLERLIQLEKKLNIEEKIQQELEWLKDHKNLIEELSQINKIICSVEKIVKTEGLGKNSIEQCEIILSGLTTENGKIVHLKLTQYFAEMTSLMKTDYNILCTSDILESAFGKYKNYIGNNPMAGITNLALCIAAFTSPLEENVVKKALESTTVGAIKKWTREFIGKTLIQKRREAFSSVQNIKTKMGGSFSLKYQQI